MNLWANRTVKIAEKEDYLDRLYEVYPNEPKERYIEEKAIESIKKSYDKRNCSELLVKLLKLEKFPYKDSYISFLRKDPSAIDRNPQTSKRICETIYGMGFDKLREGVTQPKEANTRR